jgi:hypothetical protein
MKKSALLLGLAILSVAWCACSPPDQVGIRYSWVVPRYDPVDQPREPLPNAAYARTQPDTYVAYLPPFDQAGWFESKLTSRRIRGQNLLRIGCTNCPSSPEIDCGPVNNCLGCSYVTLNFDFTSIQEDAQIVSAKLAVMSTYNAEAMKRTVLKARLNIGGDWAVVSGEPEFMGNWVLYDITAFACRAVIEKRNSTSFEISLPCGAGGQTSVATVAMNWENSTDENLADVRNRKMTEPRIIFEYR